MQEGLFRKHIQQIISRTDAKKKIIIFLKETTGIDIEEDEIILSNKTLQLSTTSVKKTKLMQKGCKEKLLEIGYILKV